MFILCDTCSIIMLLRIVPEMFNDDRYECCTITELRNEIFRRQKFKNKYPWLEEYRERISCLPLSIAKENDSFDLFLEAINHLVDHGTVNEKSGHLFDLSPEDKNLLAWALSFGFKITTGDANLKDFAVQEFSGDFKGNFSPLGIINMWIRKGLIEWNDTLHEYLRDWARNNEHPQPKYQKVQFRKLTGRRYPGS